MYIFARTMTFAFLPGKPCVRITKHREVSCVTRRCRYGLGAKMTMGARMAADAKTAEEPATTTAMMDKFCGWFRGDFDNFLQVSQEIKNEVAFRERHEHMHVRVTPMPDGFLAEKGVRLVFANYYYEGRPHIAYRRRFYELIPTENNGKSEIEMRIYKMSWAHDLRVMGCNHNFNLLDMSTLKDTSMYQYIVGAEIYWKEEGERFVGYMQDGGFVDATNGLRRTDDLILSKETLWPCERVYNKEETQIGGNRDGVPHKMMRVHEEDELRWTMDPSLPFIDPL